MRVTNVTQIVMTGSAIVVPGNTDRVRIEFWANEANSQAAFLSVLEWPGANISGITIPSIPPALFFSRCLHGQMVQGQFSIVGTAADTVLVIETICGDDD